MNKEEILAIAQKENKGKDIEKLEADRKGGALATIVAAIFAGIMFFTELFLRSKIVKRSYCIFSKINNNRHINKRHTAHGYICNAP